MRVPRLLLAALLAATPARAALTSAQLGAVGVHPPPGAAAPMRLALTGADGGAATLGEAGRRRPLVLVFADYGCTTLCGPALALTGERLADSGLIPGRDYRLAVVGLNPDAPGPAMRAFVAARLPAAVLPAAVALSGDAGAVRRLAASVGYGYAWDGAERAFAHPVAAFVLTPQGRVSRTLSEVALTAPELRRAIDDAALERTGGLLETVALVCHRALLAAGRFDGAVLTGMRTAAALLLAAGAVAMVALVRRGRRVRPC